MKTTVLIVTLAFATSFLFAETPKVTNTTNVMRESVANYLHKHIDSLHISRNTAKLTSDGNIFQVVQTENTIKGFRDSFLLERPGDYFNANFNSDTGTSSFYVEEITSERIRIHYRTVYRMKDDTIRNDTGTIILQPTDA